MSFAALQTQPKKLSSEDKTSFISDEVIHFKEKDSPEINIHMVVEDKLKKVKIV